jgi:hypothetical protein
MHKVGVGYLIVWRINIEKEKCLWYDRQKDGIDFEM